MMSADQDRVYRGLLSFGSLLISADEQVVEVPLSSVVSLVARTQAEARREERAAFAKVLESPVEGTGVIGVLMGTASNNPQPLHCPRCIELDNLRQQLLHPAQEKG